MIREFAGDRPLHVALAWLEGRYWSASRNHRGGDERILHTDPSCYRLKTTTRALTRGHNHLDIGRLCKGCLGIDTYNDNGGQRPEHIQRIIERRQSV